MAIKNFLQFRFPNRTLSRKILLRSVIYDKKRSDVKHFLSHLKDNKSKRVKRNGASYRIDRIDRRSLEPSHTL